MKTLINFAKLAVLTAYLLAILITLSIDVDSLTIAYQFAWYGFLIVLVPIGILIKKFLNIKFNN